MVLILKLLFVFVCLTGIFISFKKESLFLTICFVIVFFVGVSMEINSRNESYKQGQVDALKGDVKYELQVSQDSIYVRK